MIEIFKTNVQKTTQAQALIALLLEYFPGSKVNFDLEDCDRVLRIEGDNFLPGKVMMLVNERGFQCNIIE